MSENTEDKSIDLKSLDDEMLLEALRATGEMPHTPTEQEQTAPLFQNSLQDYITVPDGGLVFRTTSGRPLMRIAPDEGGTRLDLYGAGLFADIQLFANSQGCVIHLAQQGKSHLSLSAQNPISQNAGSENPGNQSPGSQNAGSQITARNQEGTVVAYLSSEENGANLSLHNADGQIVHYLTSAVPTVDPASISYALPSMLPPNTTLN